MNKKLIAAKLSCSSVPRLDLLFQYLLCFFEEKCIIVWIIACPKFVKFGQEKLHILWVLQYQHVFPVGLYGLSCPVEGAGDKYLFVYDSKFMVHVASLLIMAHLNPCKAEQVQPVSQINSHLPKVSLQDMAKFPTNRVSARCAKWSQYWWFGYTNPSIISTGVKKLPSPLIKPSKWCKAPMGHHRGLLANLLFMSERATFNHFYYTDMQWQIRIHFLAQIVKSSQCNQ